MDECIRKQSLPNCRWFDHCIAALFEICLTQAGSPWQGGAGVSPQASGVRVQDQMEVWPGTSRAVRQQELGLDCCWAVEPQLKVSPVGQGSAPPGSLTPRSLAGRGSSPQLHYPMSVWSPGQEGAWFQGPYSHVLRNEKW